MNSEFFLALLGYAIGTAQVVLIDWFGQIREHRKGLRLIRAELQGLREYDNLYERLIRMQDWVLTGAPHMPDISSVFVETVSKLDWEMTNSRVDDDTHTSLNLLADLARRIQGKQAQLRRDLGTYQELETVELRIEGKKHIENLCDMHDRDSAVFQYLVDDLLADINRRLEICDSASQLQRRLDVLPSARPIERLEYNSPKVVHHTALRKIEKVTRESARLEREALQRSMKMNHG